MKFFELYNHNIIQELWYDMPDDRGKSLYDLIQTLSDISCRELIVTELDTFRLSIDYEPLAFNILQVSSDLSVTDAHPILLHGELIVPAAARERVEEVLALQPHIPVQWTELVSVSGLPAGMQSFANAWEAMIGPNLSPMLETWCASHQFLMA